MKFFVVTLPSTVMAKVAATNGRKRLALPGYGTDLFGLANFMLERSDFGFHFAEFNVASLDARFVKQINNAAREGTEENNGEGHEPN